MSNPGVSSPPHIASISIAAARFPQEDVYPFNLEVLQKTPAITLSSPVSFFVGENGSGKSTLLKAVARRCGIYIWSGIQRTRYAPNPYEEQLSRYLEVEWRDGRVPGSFFAAEMFRSFSQLVDDWASSDPGLLEYFGNRSLLSQSHGQGHLAFFRSRFALRGSTSSTSRKTPCRPAANWSSSAFSVRRCRPGTASS